MSVSVCVHTEGDEDVEEGEKDSAGGARDVIVLAEISIARFTVKKEENNMLNLLNIKLINKENKSINTSNN